MVALRNMRTSLLVPPQSIEPEAVVGISADAHHCFWLDGDGTGRREGTGTGAGARGRNRRPQAPAERSRSCSMIPEKSLPAPPSSTQWR